jgi:hypothetical protein
MWRLSDVRRLHLRRRGEMRRLGAGRGHMGRRRAWRLDMRDGGRMRRLQVLRLHMRRGRR